MLLAIDIGNSQIVIGIMDGEKVVKVMRAASDKKKTADEYAFMILDFLQINGLKRELLDSVIISSVVPVLKQSLKEASETLLSCKAILVEPGIKTGLDVRINNPSELGADLIVNAAASLNYYKPPLIIIDMGTATTISYIDKDSVYRGGLIIPGLRTAVNALAAGAAQLREIDFDSPSRLIGKCTVECMKSGAIYGQAAMLDGIIDRISEEEKSSPEVTATGGLMKFILPYMKHSVHYDENLLLKGLYFLYLKNAEIKSE